MGPWGLWAFAAWATDPAPLEIAAGVEDGASFRWSAELASRVVEPRVLVQPSNGSVDNLEQVVAGRADLGLVQGDVAWHGVYGDGRVGRADDVVALGVVQAELVHLVVRADSGVLSVADLAGKRVGVGPVGSGTLLNSLDVLAAHGVEGADLEFFTAYGVERVQNGALDAVFNTTVAPFARFLGAGDDVRLLPIEHPGLEAAPYYRFDALPAGYGEGRGMYVDTLLVARADLDPAVVDAVLDTGLLTGDRVMIPLHPRAAARFGVAEQPIPVVDWSPPPLPALPPPAHRGDTTGDDLPVRYWTVDDVVRAALAANPAVTVAVLTERVERLQADQAQRAFTPTLTVGSGVAVADGVGSFADALSIEAALPTGTSVVAAVDATSSSLGRDNTWGADASITVEQALLEGADLDLGLASVRVARLEAERARAGVELAANELVASIAKSYADLAAAHARVALQEGQADLAARHLNRVRAMFEAGRESALAVEEASFSLATAERDLLVDQQSLRDVEDVLLDATQARFAWRLVPVGDVRAAARAPLPEGDGLQKRLVTAVARRPDLRQLAIDLQRARVDLAAARNRALPSLGVYGTAGRVSGGDDGSALGAGVGAVAAGAPYLEGGVSLSMPLGPAADPLGLDAARLVVTTREIQLTDKVEGVQREVRAAWRDVELSTQRFVVASQAAALADRKLSLTIEEFRERKTDSFKVLRYQDDLLAARLSEIEAATDVIQARAELDRVTGVGADPFRGVVDQVEVR